MDTTSILILAAACLVMGVVLDNLVRLLTKKDTKPEGAPAQPPVEPPKAASAPAGPAGLEEVARLWEENETHILVVEAAGKQYRLARELTSETRLKLESTLERLSNWLGKPLPASLSPQAEHPAAESPAEPAPPAAAPIAIDMDAAGLPSSLPTVKKVSLNPVDVVANAFQADVALPAVTKSLAEQVDEILQEKLLDSPLREKKIRLLDLPGGGLVVMVGLQKFDGIDAVPDEQVRAMLHEAVDEWGKRAKRRKV